MKVHLHTPYYDVWTMEKFVTDPDAKILWCHIDSILLEHRSYGVISGKRIKQNYTFGLFSSAIDGCRPLTPILTKLMDSVNHKLATNFNSLIIEKYADGNSHSICHLERGKRSIAIISLGTDRIFRFHTVGRYCDIETRNCQLLIMEGNFINGVIQQIMKRGKLKDPAIYLIFKRI